MANYMDNLFAKASKYSNEIELLAVASVAMIISGSMPRWALVLGGGVLAARFYKHNPEISQRINNTVSKAVDNCHTVIDRFRPSTEPVVSVKPVLFSAGAPGVDSADPKDPKDPKDSETSELIERPMNTAKKRKL